MVSYKIYKNHIIVIIMEMMILISLIASNVDAIPSEEWNKTYQQYGRIFCNDYTCYTIAKSVQQTKDGGYILAGYAGFYVPPPGYPDEYDSSAWLIKTDSNGNKQWNKTFGGIGEDQIYYVNQTSDSGYILAGHTNGNVWLIKTDVNGNKQWSKTFGGKNYDVAYSVRQTKDGGYILVGETLSFGVGDADAWVIKTDSNGNKQWSKTFGGIGGDQIYYVGQTSDGGYILVGETWSFGMGETDAWLIKTDPNGNKQWSKTFGGKNYDWIRSVQQTKEGGYILIGGTSSFGAGNWDIWLIKTDNNGNKQWSKTFGGEDYDVAYSVQQTKDGGYILVGETNSYGSGGSDVWLIKTDSNGNKQWVEIFGKTSGDIAYSVQQTKDGGYILAGQIQLYGDDDIAWLIKVEGEYSITVLSPNGGENWARGTAHTIKWNSNSSVGYVKIELFKGGIYKSTIVSSTANDGSYSWTIPRSLFQGYDYKIKITNTSDSAYNDWSNNYFKIY